MDMNEATSKAIAAERSAAHLTIKELAKKANLNERTLIRLLQNERNINVIQLAQLAEVFGVYPHELIEAAERFIERAERGPVSLSVEPDSNDATARDYYAMAAKHGDIEAEQERERRVEETKRILADNPMELAAYTDPDKEKYIEYGNGDDPA